LKYPVEDDDEFDVACGERVREIEALKRRFELEAVGTGRGVVRKARGIRNERGVIQVGDNVLGDDETDAASRVRRVLVEDDLGGVGADGEALREEDAGIDLYVRGGTNGVRVIDDRRGKAVVRAELLVNGEGRCRGAWRARRVFDDERLGVGRGSFGAIGDEDDLGFDAREPLME
jgi:hypothetical protein